MNLGNIKIVFLDIDGTLVNDDKEITETTKDSIKRVVDKGIYVVITSGRDLIHTVEKSQEANASSIVIATNGSEVFDYGKSKYIFHDVIDSDSVVKIWDYCINNEIGLILKSKECVYYNKYSLKKEELQYKLISNISECDGNEISQLLIMSKSEEKMDKVNKFIYGLNLVITSCSSSYFVDPNRDYYSSDVNNKNVSKGMGINCLLEYLNIKKEESICFGDFLNDVDMFEASGIKVAMGNAIDELKEKADYITDTNNQDGVANFLNKYL